MDDAIARDSIQLRSQLDARFDRRTHSNPTRQEPIELSQHSLPPVDGGRSAWLFLAGCFLIELVVWGFPFSFGVLQDYYNTHPPISDDPSHISAVGTTCSGILYLLAPPTFLSFNFSPHLRRYSTFYALPVIVLALMLSSLATQVWHLILTQGVLYAVGGCFLYYPVFLYIDEWFVRRKAFAYGILWAGSSSGGLVGPFLLQWGLPRYGVAVFLRGWAVALAVAGTPLLFCVRPRLPASGAHNPDWKQSMRNTLRGFAFVQIKEFWILQFGNVVQGLGYFVPLLYLPTYATSKGLPNSLISLLPALVSISATPGLLFLTTLSDRSISVHTLVLISSLGSAMAVLILWGFASKSVALLVLFSLAYGFFAGSFSAVYPGVAKELRTSMVRRQEQGSGSGLAGADLGSIFGLFGLGRGVGNILCGPVSGLLLKGSTGGYGSGYGPLILFTGVTMAITTGSTVLLYFFNRQNAHHGC